jgi:ADP-Ribosyltransferase in polyvalent proteins
MKHSSEQLGAQSNSEAYKKFATTENPSFKAWFDGSKIKDELGRPLLMYHGTYLDFGSFAANHAFHCLTPDPVVAELHAEDSYAFFKNESGGASIIIMPLYVRVVRPFDPRLSECIALMEEWELGGPSSYRYAEWEILEDLDVVARIRLLGFDGIWMREEEEYNYLAVFHPRQLKSAIGNSGRFNPENDSLTDPQEGAFTETRLGVPIIEACSYSPYLEMFARHSRPGWQSWGNEVDSSAVSRADREQQALFNPMYL